MKRSLIPILLFALAGIVAYPAFVSSTVSDPDPPCLDVACDARDRGPFEDPYCCECVNPPDPKIEIYVCEQTDFLGRVWCCQDPSFICWESTTYCDPEDPPIE